MQHANDRIDQAQLDHLGASGACARCGRPMPVTRAGKVKLGVRYCSAPCRTDDVRDRRATARADLLRALDDLRALESRIRAALAVMGHTRF
jgi:hypothetical protein